jgi:hypothetical protein
MIRNQERSTAPRVFSIKTFADTIRAAEAPNAEKGE